MAKKKANRSPRRRPPAEKRERKPTAKQRAFAEFYTGEAAGNGTEAARLAKYKGNDATLAQVASENLKKHEVQKLIDELNAEVKSASLMNRRQVQEWLVRVIRGDECRSTVFSIEGPVPDPQRPGHYLTREPPPKDRIKAMELYAKIRRYLVERRELTGKGGGPVPVQVIRIGDKEIAF